jgi:adenylate kinase family enzyme
MRVVVLGPPGSGKSTRAKIIGKIYGLPVITSSVLLRKLADKNTDRGSLVQSSRRKVS